jgi:4-hydroxy-4-methyl-2-oxoglutarate aldolase
MTPSPTEITLDMMRQSLTAAVVSDALDALGHRRHSPSVALRPVTVCDRVLVGRCKTTLWADMAHPDPRPYELELQAVDSCQTDEVLVCAANGSTRSGVWGELLTTAAKNRGCVGALVDGMVRDVRQMAKMSFPVWARGTNVLDSLHRQRVIDVDVPVEIDAIEFRSGDLLIADIDGVVVVPRELEAEAIRRAWDKVHAESVTREAIRNGMLASEAYATFGVL